MWIRVVEIILDWCELDDMQFTLKKEEMKVVP